MEEIIAYCGLDCLSCPIYKATRLQDKKKQKEKREEIVRLIKEHYGVEFKLEDITDCDGCTAENGKLFSGCNDCPIRKCAKQKEIEFCVHCDEYICEKLEEFFAKEPHAKENLDRINKQ